MHLAFVCKPRPIQSKAVCCLLLNSSYPKAEFTSDLSTIIGYRNSRIINPII